MISKNHAPQQITESIYWLGSSDISDFLQINIYMVYRNGKGIIIDPGPRNIFRETLKAAREIAPIEEIKALILSNQDPDICSSLPSWEEAGFSGDLVSHWKTGMFIDTYGLLSPRHSIKDEMTEPVAELNRLRFITIPYLHSPGNLLTFDNDSGTLFSSDLFGAFGRTDELFAADSYFRKMITYQNNFIPSTGQLEVVLERIGGLDVRRICPQHGCIIEEQTERFISELTRHVKGAGRNTVNQIFNIEGGQDDWEDRTFDLNEELVLSSDEKLLDQVTGLYNSSFFLNFLPEFLKSNKKGTLAYFRLDGMKSFNNAYGHQEGDRAIATFASIIQEGKPADSYLFRESGPILVFMVPGVGGEQALDVIEMLQNRIRESGDFIQDMTCSSAVADISETGEQEEDRDDMLIRLIRKRLQLLDSMGPDSICNTSENENQETDALSVILVDPDPVSSELLKEYFSDRNFSVTICRDGSEALHKIDLTRPAAVISEIQIPQMDGFRLREKLLQSGELRDIPFIFLTHLKTRDSVRRAHKLGVLFYLRKPVMLSELHGIVKNRIAAG